MRDAGEPRRQLDQRRAARRAAARVEDARSASIAATRTASSGVSVTVPEPPTPPASVAGPSRRELAGEASRTWSSSRLSRLLGRTGRTGRTCPACRGRPAPPGGRPRRRRAPASTAARPRSPASSSVVLTACRSVQSPARVVRVAGDHQPGEAEGVACVISTSGRVRVGVEQRHDVVLGAGERRARRPRGSRPSRCRSACSPSAVCRVIAALGTRNSESRSAGLAPAAPGGGVPEPHQAPQPVGRPSSAWIRASCSSRCSSEGWVEVRVLQRGAADGRRDEERVHRAARPAGRAGGMAAISPVIFCSAEASAAGFIVR